MIDEMRAMGGSPPTRFKLLNDGSVRLSCGDFAIRFYAKDPSWIKIRDERLFIYEWREYRVKIDPPEKESKSVRVFFGDEEAERDENFWKYIFKNYIGKSRLRVFYDGRLVLEYYLDVISPKFIHLGIKEDIDNYLDFVESVTGELIRYALELPFDIKAPTGFRVEESYKPISPLFAYHFFKDNKEKIVSAYEHILSIPHRKLEELEEWVSLAEVTTIDEELIMGIVSKPELWRKYGYPHPLAEKTRGFIPEKFHQWEKYESLDTQENRFAKHFLERMGFWLEEVLEWIRRIGYNAPAFEEVTELQSYVEAALNNPIFSGIGDLHVFPSQSQVLLKREGYRELLELWRLFNSYTPIFSEINEAIANKRVDKLYEYWCFFELSKELEEVFGELKSIEVGFSDTGEIEEGKAIAKFEGDFRLVYNRRFSRSKKESYSVPLKPDYALLRGEDLVAVFDAKFRFEDRLAHLGVENLEGEIERAKEIGDIELLAKLEDIFKMHTYRDALGTNAAVILYPGNVNKFFMIDGNIIEKNKKAMLRLILNDEIEGIGFLNFVPWKAKKRNTTNCGNG